MVGVKTAALLSACTELGALAAGASEPTRVACRQFGYSLGLAFQAQDDILGIWGNASLTGKSAESDLVAGKKSPQSCLVSNKMAPSQIVGRMVDPA
jgi:geranylgeranyl diphosphate synthase type I